VTQVDSDVTWLGEVPAHWRLDRLGGCFKERKETVSDSVYEPLSVTKSGVVPQLDSAAKSDNSEGRKLIRAGDFVINSRSDRKGSAGVAATDGSCSVIYTVLQPIAYQPEYAHHLLRSEPFQEEFYRWGSGIAADLWSTRYSSMKQILVPVPPIDEQKAIAEFLDRETAQIDNLIAKQEQLIDKLKSRWEAKLLKSITFGNQTQCELVDSGVLGLGFVNSNLEMVPLRHLVIARAGGTPKSDEDENWSETGLPWIAIGDMSQGLTVHQTARKVSDIGINAKNLPIGKPGTILFAMYASVGETAVLGTEATWNQAILGLEPKSVRIQPAYLQLVLEAYRPFWKFYTTASTQDNLNQQSVLSTKIPLPSIEEQEILLRMLIELRQKHDVLMDKSRELVEGLKERRQALISAAVTGKIPVGA
jgi:type I restriction enzyme, S subunit